MDKIINTGSNKSKLKKKKYFTIMFIPHSQTNISQLKIPIKAFTCLMVLLVILACSFAFYAVDITRNLAAAKGDLDRLRQIETVNQAQTQMITELIEITKGMESKIADMEQLDREVREIVGLDSHDLQDYNSSAFMETDFSLAMTGVGGVASRGQMMPRANESNVELLEVLRDDLIMLDQIIDTKEESLSQLQVEVSNQLRYLAARPDLMPVNGTISSTFGYRRNPFGRGMEFHNGLDIAARRGTPIVAAGSGRVIFSGWVPGYGRMISIDHGFGYVSHYGHNSVNLVQVGDTVEKGELIARVGTSGRATGPHVHFMIDHNGRRINPQNVLK